MGKVYLTEAMQKDSERKRYSVYGNKLGVQTDRHRKRERERDRDRKRQRHRDTETQIVQTIRSQREQSIIQRLYSISFMETQWASTKKRRRRKEEEKNTNCASNLLSA